MMNRTISRKMLVLIFFIAAMPLGDVVAADMNCILEPYEVLELASPIPGILEAVMVTRGDRIRRGTVVARLHSSAERAAVKLAEARAEFGKRKIERNEQLYLDELISVHEKDEMNTESRIAELELEEAKALLERRTIRSPISGIVTEKNLAAGELAQGSHIMTIAQINPLNVEVLIPVDRYGEISVGDVATVTPAIPGDQQYKATVTTVDVVIDAASGTFGVRLELPNSDRRIPAGSSCSIEF